MHIKKRKNPIRQTNYQANSDACPDCHTNDGQLENFVDPRNYLAIACLPAPVVGSRIRVACRVAFGGDRGGGSKDEKAVPDYYRIDTSVFGTTLPVPAGLGTCSSERYKRIDPAWVIRP